MPPPRAAAASACEEGSTASTAELHKPPQASKHAVNQKHACKVEGQLIQPDSLANTPCKIVAGHGRGYGDQHKRQKPVH